MPRTPQQFEEIREEKRNLIMDVALEHFADKGFHATTISHIAKHAGISKGLMYNYFTGKEELLAQIIKRSVQDIWLYFDPDRDGKLTKEEFELFIRKMTFILRERRSVWRLFFQMMMQNDVREQIAFYRENSEYPSGIAETGESISLLQVITNMLRDYFRKNAHHKNKEYDPDVELDLFLVTLKGIAVTFVLMEDEKDENEFNRTIDRFIQLYK